MWVRSICFFFFSSRRRHTRLTCDWSSDVCSSDLDHGDSGCETASETPLEPLADVVRCGQWGMSHGRMSFFDRHLREWVRTACAEWGWPEPEEGYHTKVTERLPTGLCAIIAFGLAERLILST